MKWSRIIGISAAVVVVGLVALSAYVWSAFSSVNGWNDQPPRLTRHVTPADVLGTWQYASDYPKAAITITLNIDGTYLQSVSPSSTATTRGAPQTQSGKWEIKDDFLYVHGVLMATGDGKWSPNDDLGLWEIVESRQRPGQAAIDGGAIPDPDAWHEFTKLEAATRPSK